MNVILRCIKHLLLFIFSNIIAAIIMGLILAIFDGYFRTDIVSFMGGALMASIFGMIFTIIPYIIGLFIIKTINKPPLWAQRFEIWNKISVIKNIIGFVANYQIIFALFLSKRW